MHRDRRGRALWMALILAPLILAQVTILGSSARAADGASPIARGSSIVHNVILFVPDGLRAPLVDSTTAPTMARLRDEGVNFVNSHSLFPTFTTANASAFATGHGLGDTGDYSNAIYTRLPFQGSVTPFLESDLVQQELNVHLRGNYLHEPSILGSAAALPEEARIQTAVIGKLGPVAIFDPSIFAGSPTVLFDDNTGQPDKGVPLPARWQQAIERAKVRPTAAPGRGDNARSGTFISGLAQQQYFLEVATRVVLPEFAATHRPFVLVYWTRDPDGTQHTQGDGRINGPTSKTAVREADGALAAIEQTLKSLGLLESTNIIVAADHGFSTISKQASGRELSAGFLALDLQALLVKSHQGFTLFDPDRGDAAVDPAKPVMRRGNGLIGESAALPQVIVAANGGSDLIYLPALGRNGPLAEESLAPAAERRRIRALGRQIVQFLTERDYVSGIFIDEKTLGRIAGALSMESIGLIGSALTPRPAIVVNFASTVSSPCEFPAEKALLCTNEISDTEYPAGGGMHGNFNRADTWNFMAARGPDFRKGFMDGIPASNADIGMTIARLLGLDLKPVGALSGRVLTESLIGYQSEPLPEIRAETMSSDPASNGQRTILKTQLAAGHRYFDAGGFKGRTAGLD